MTPYSITTCVHWQGSANICRALVDVETLRDQHGRVPCAVIKGVTGELACDRIEMPPQPPVEDAGRMMKLLERSQAGRCPHCGEVVEGEMEFNGNLLALPCRHVIKHARD